MVNEHARFAIQKQLERDADAALKVLSMDERSSLWRVVAGDTQIPEPHKRKLRDLCLAAERGGRLELTRLGQCAAGPPPGHSAAAKHEAASHEIRLFL